MIRLLHVGDLHLGSPLSAFGDAAANRQDRLQEIFGQLPEVAREHDAAALLVAGDLFDAPQPPRRLRRAVKAVARALGELACPVFIVPGASDAHPLSAGLYEDLADVATVFTEPAFAQPATVDTKDGPLHVYGLAFDPLAEPDPLTTFRRISQPGTHVVLVHGVLGTLPVAPSDDNDEPVELRFTGEALARIDADYIALGGSHDFRSPLKVDPGNRVPACYAGSFAAQDLTETGRRGYVVAELDEDKRPQVVLHSANVGEITDLGRFDVSEHTTAAAIVRILARQVPEGATPIAQLHGTPSFPLDCVEIEAALKDRFGHAAIGDRTSFFLSKQLTELASQDSIPGHVGRLGRRRIEEARTEDERVAADRALRLALKELDV